jgi:O-antigen/teichoic acid export membrane protein
VVSGTNFLTTILIGRWCGAGELGVYSLGFSLLVAWACAQEALIALPYTIYRHRPLLGSPREFAGSSLAHQWLLSALALIVLVATAAALFWEGAVPGLAAVTWALAGVMPFTLLREFGRRFAFAHLRMAEALLLDVAAAAVQLAGLATLAWAGTLWATGAFAAIAGACSLTSAVWLYLARDHFVIRWRQAWQMIGPSWSVGKWLFASQVTLSVQGYFIHWLLAWTLGATATGMYVACLTVILFFNPLILGISNSLAPQACTAFHEGGAAELRRVVFRTTGLLGLAMALFCAVVMAGGDDLMALLYRGEHYEGHGHTITVLALAMLAAALGMPASNGLAAIEWPDVIFKVGLVTVLLSVVLVPFLVAGWGVTGAAYGFLAGNVAGSLGRWLAFSALVRQDRPPAQAESVSWVLRQLTGAVDEDGWVIEQLNEGAQASVFAARRKDGRPIWQANHELAIKLYKPAARQEAEVVRGQFASLERLHARLNGSSDGWNVCVPAPLYRCEEPLALVMTLVPGRSLNACLETIDQVPGEALEPIARAIVAALERCWSSDEQAHGDLNFDNILCDVPGRSLSFVDPGVIESDAHCAGVSRKWYPASRDLAYLLYDSGVTVRRTFGQRGARQRQQGLVERVLRVFLLKVRSGAGQAGPAGRDPGLYPGVSEAAAGVLVAARPVARAAAAHRRPAHRPHPGAAAGRRGRRSGFPA